MRRRRAQSRKRSCTDVWPIDPGAGTPPPNWPGWPKKKRFAVVLTHDVEGAKGLARTLQLMEVERKHGFRSSFNFVPKGEYRVDEATRNTLDVAGFEVGVHGLEHDGKLYRSKSGFADKATRIRAYMQEWNATGFRSPLMQHKLGWLHQLGVEYDASTFDTDPFEPQSDGFRTIFPFWVPAPSGGGYLELPYTLVQDFTLFTILGQANADIWKAKVDWIAARGGMVLLNTHPDYICFEGTPQRDEFPLSYYEEFLSYVNSKYQDQFWSALPRDVARYYRSTLTAELRNTRRRVCIVTDSKCGTDLPLREYIEALLGSGDHVEVIALSPENTSATGEFASGTTVTRLKHDIRDSANAWNYAFRLLQCMFALSVHLTRRHSRVQYDLIHFCNLPHCLVFSAWYAKQTGAKIILDVHGVAGPVPSRPGKVYATFQRAIEAASARFVDHIIASTRSSQGERGSSSSSQEKDSSPREGRADVRPLIVVAPIDAPSLLSDGTMVQTLARGEEQAMTSALLEQNKHQNGNGLITRDIKSGDVGKENYLDIVTALLVERF
jgi:peptidoglycan/xylan/chitin deacetylase (PgdA/CDA1 family)